MSLAFLIPAALAALAALLIPLAIHLARRSEQRPTEFAALRWLRQKPKPRHRIRFDEWPLLIVRLLLVALMALLLARPVLHGGQAHTPYVAVAPGVDLSRARATLASEPARWHWLAPGFPSVDASPVASDTSVSSLLRELDATLPDDVALTVFVPERLEHADGRRIVLSREVDWRIVPGALPADAAQKAPAPPALVVRHAADRASAARFLRAAALAWRTDPAAKVDTASSEQPLPTSAKHLAWLAPGNVPTQVREWTRNGGTLLLDTDAKLADATAWAPLWRDEAGSVLIEAAAYGRGRVLRFTRTLAPQAMPELLDATFPQHLRAALEPPAAMPSRVATAEHAPLTGGATYPIAPRDLQPWLALLIALVFLLERWLATSSRRGAAP
ncbi:BatA domain-containing protein [Lysobacter auxotrophicus]|uniref:BatA domain-containing protein n=1 Tax=Lysobacter auxotrophicus TaxID=2992573 RepID=A0ABN6UP57_9GAMM|nr:BatA domain-containing protein [Lysobacter auxotrophicus]BDU18185.1 BatA domain-containing protein [Lysobacter auxotrophicus]